HLEHRARALAVASRDDGRMNPKITMFLKVAMNGHRETMAHSRNRTEGIRSRPQMRDFAQVFERMPLGRDRIRVGVIDPSDDCDLVGLDLVLLAFSLRLNKCSTGLHRASSRKPQDVDLVILQSRRRDDLYRVEARTITHMQK